MEAVVAAFKAQHFPQLQALIPCEPSHLRSQHDVAAAKSYSDLQKDLFGDAGVIEEYRVKLAETLGALLNSLLAENERIGEEKCVLLLKELYAPVEIKLKENAFASFNEYEQQRRAVIQSYKDRAPKVDRREEILLQFIVDAIASASQMLYNKLSRDLEQAVSQHKETLEVERRKAMEMRMGLERDRDVAKANLDSLSANLADAKAREDSARKSVEQLEASLRSEKEDFKQRQKELEASNKDMQVCYVAFFVHYLCALIFA
jgi:chromosome segregation ATPase